jgi:hypothetical protein
MAAPSVPAAHGPRSKYLFLLATIQPYITELKPTEHNHHSN